MGRHYVRERVSLISLAVAIAAQGSAAAAAQDQQQPDEQAGEAGEPQAAAVTPVEAAELEQEITKTIVVTGSRIPRPNLTAVSPVTVIGGEEVKLEGAIMAEELLNQLPQVAPSQGAFISNGSTGTATVDLRNLGAARTLVLVNGRRLGPGDPESPVPDINIIPTTLIQRVEVLTGGASSVYGSDAVSGVVNFILDTRLNGLRVDGQASVFQHDNRNGSGLVEALDLRGFPYPTGNAVDGGRQDINAAFGKGFFDDRAHVTLYAGYRQIEPVTQDARDYSACSAQVSQLDNTLLECGGSGASFPGRFVTRFVPVRGIMTIGPDRTFVPGAPLFNFGPWNYYQRSGRRYTAGGFADAEISPAINPYVEVMYMKDRSVAQIAPSAAFGNVRSINCDNPLLSEQQRSLVCFDGNYVGQNPFFDNQGNLIEVRGSPIPFVDPVTGATYLKGNLVIIRRAVESGGRQSDIRHETFRLLGGLKGEIGRGVSYDASYLRSRAHVSRAHLNDFSKSRLIRAMDVIADPTTGEPVCRSVLTGEDPDCVPWDIFALDGVTQAATAYLNVPAFSEGSVTEQIGNLNATVDLRDWGWRSPWADEYPALNVGAEYRDDRLDFEPDELAQSGDLAGVPGEIQPIHGSTEVKELFGEVRIPLVGGRLIESLVFEGGYRQSWYSAEEASFTVSAYKLALDLTPVAGLRFRASKQRAVRAPNIIELFSPPTTDGFFVDPCEGSSPRATAAQCALTGVTAAQYGQIIPLPQGVFSGFNAIGGGNQELQPERATTLTFGVVLEPRFLRGFNATIDWWDIRLDDAISYVSGGAIMLTCIETGDPIFCDRIHRDPEGSLWLTPEGFVDTRLLNIGSLEVRGVDVAANYRRGLGRFGSGTLSFLGSYVDRYVIDNGGLAEPYDCAGNYGLLCTNPVPRWRHKARVTWEPGAGPSLSLQWRYIGKMSIEPIPSFPPAGPLSASLPSKSYFDLSALFRVRQDLVLRLGVNNILDSEPPLVPFGEGGCVGFACNGNTYPQWYDPLGRFIFAGFTVNL